MASTEFVVEGADVTGEGEDFQNFKMAVCAHFVLAPPIACLRYFGSASVFGPALVYFPDFSYISYWRHLLDV